MRGSVCREAPSAAAGFISRVDPNVFSEQPTSQRTGSSLLPSPLTRSPSSRLRLAKHRFRSTKQGQHGITARASLITEQRRNHLSDLALRRSTSNGLRRCTLCVRATS